MKKKSYFMLVAAVAVGMVLASCGSSKEMAYRKAYEKAKAQDMSQQQPQQPVVAQPIVEAPTAPATPVATEVPEVTTVQSPTAQVTAQADVPVRKEAVNLVQGSGLKAYSVVVGSFGIRANAEGLMATLKSKGYDAQLAVNPINNMYRVIVSSFDSREEAVKGKQAVLGVYPDAWLLLKQ